MVKERLEKMVRQAAKKLEAQGVCKLWKIPNDLRITGSSDLVYAEQTPCDFFGHNRDGRVIMIECKDISGARLPFTSAGYKPHQRTALEECSKAGGSARLVWKHGNRVVILSPWEIAKLSEGRRSLPWRVVEEHSRPFTCDELAKYIREAVT